MMMKKRRKEDLLCFALHPASSNINEEHLSFYLTDEVKRKRDDNCFITIFFSSFTVSTFGCMMNGAKCSLIFFSSFTGIVALLFSD
jgi:hypothetical protein